MGEKFTEEELKEKAKKLSEREQEWVRHSTDCILFFLKRKNVDYSSFEDELKNTIDKNISASLMMSKILIAFL